MATVAEQAFHGSGGARWTVVGGEVTVAFDLSRLLPFAHEPDLGRRGLAVDGLDQAYLGRLLAINGLVAEIRWRAEPGWPQARCAILLRIAHSGASPSDIDEVMAALTSPAAHLYVEPFTDRSELQRWLAPIDADRVRARAVRRVLDGHIGAAADPWWAMRPIACTHRGRPMMVSSLLEAEAPVVLSTSFRAANHGAGFDQWVQRQIVRMQDAGRDRIGLYGGQRITYPGDRFARRAAGDLAGLAKVGTPQRVSVRSVLLSPSEPALDRVTQALALAFPRAADTGATPASSLVAWPYEPGEAAAVARWLEPRLGNAVPAGLPAPVVEGLETVSGIEAADLALLPRQLDGPSMRFPSDTHHLGGPRPPEPGLVFLSYASAASSRFEVVRRTLAHAELPLWWDAAGLRAGNPIDAGLREALDLAGCVVVVVSHEALSSTWVRTFELPRALERGVPVIQALFDGQQPLLQDILAIPIRGAWPPPPDHPDLQRLRAHVEQHAGAVSPSG